MRLLAVVNQKGGVGKTTTIMSLAAVLADVGTRVIVVDNDVQGSAAFWARRAEAAGNELPFDNAISNSPDELARLRELPYDIVLVDTPGNLDRRNSAAWELLRDIVKQCDFALVPTQPAALALPPTMQMIDEVVKPAGVPYRIMLNHVDGRVPDQAQSAKEAIRGAGYLCLEKYVRTYKAHEDAPALGVVVTQYKPSRSSYKAMEDYRGVALELNSLWANGHSNQTPEGA